jgi:hypothetical protein
LKGKPLEENHLIILLKDFDTNLALSYLNCVKTARDMIEAKGLYGAEEIQDGVLVDPIGFRIPFKEPIFIMLSHPICRLRSKVPYPKQVEWERFFVTHLGMVPVYLVNLNVITVLKFWGDDSSLVVSRPFQEELDKGEGLFELRPSIRPVQYSSMNFVLQYGAKMYTAPLQLLEPFQRYYGYLFWAYPGKGYTFSSHFLHRRTQITTFMKVTKSLYTIRSVGSTKQIYVQGRSIDCKEMDLVGFDFEDDNVREVKGIRSVVPIDIISELEKKDVRRCFLNAMMTELRSGTWRANLLSNILEIGESLFDLTSSLIGIQVDRLYHESDRPAYVCTLRELRSSTTKLLKQLFGLIDLPSTISDSVDHFGLALRSLYPFIIIDGERVLFAHPIILGFLAQQGMLGLVTQRDDKAMVDLLNLLEKIQDLHGSPMQIFIDPRMERFKAGNKKDSMYELLSINNRIALYKSLHQSFSDNGVGTDPSAAWAVRS